jgi:hypothetical protein
MLTTEKLKQAHDSNVVVYDNHAQPNSITTDLLNYMLEFARENNYGEPSYLWLSPQEEQRVPAQRWFLVRTAPFLILSEMSGYCLPNKKVNLLVAEFSNGKCLLGSY